MQNKAWEMSESERALIRVLLSFLVCLLATKVEAVVTWSDFESSFGDWALQSEQLKACLSIEDAGLRAGCSLTAALEAEAAAVKEGAAAETKEGQRLGRCAYREQGGPALHKFAVKMRPFLKQMLERYAALHRHCTGVEYERLGAMYASKKRPQCRYVVWSCTFGLGNKLMSLVSTYLYAILSQRVLLIDSPGWEHLFCEPFPGSPWQVPRGLSLREERWPSFAEYRNRKCGDSGGCSYVVEVAFTGESQPADHSFLVCPRAMASVRTIPFLHFRNSNQHFAVGFFQNPALRPLLEVLFPEHNVFHMLAQVLVSPSNEVWTQIKHLHHQYLAPASRNVGVQLRESKGEYRPYYDDAVPLCIQSKAAMCPIELEEQKEMEMEMAASQNSSIDNNMTAMSSRPLVSVYVASLVGGHYDSLKRSVVKLEPEMRQRFVVVAQVQFGVRSVNYKPNYNFFTSLLDADWEQREDIGHMQKALVDIWMLSLSDVLLTSHMSTFGYTTHGLGGITPFHLKPWLDNACWLSASADPCFHFAPHHVVCSTLDDNFTFANPFQAPYIVPCPDIPNTGLQLIE